ncbi:hypothetical protein [Spiroplasma turonicum]|uniref:Uncharacterized protein n=2 Tax=Spiroplasma turonicum TaxID=216946 RepID=A0A0K1P6C5_9MOLU|nr:hypothetical protein [Spiroplasma turonicum]AKU79830.1 hypothetical protein STURON_00584 [Spiroplasma turonicum]ALX70845.1 hypothetical protein STURO_v1c05790 [Spiroplasma turonicum]
MATKDYRYYACSKYIILLQIFVMRTNRLINYFRVNKNTYSKFKIKLELENTILLYKYKLNIQVINNFKNENFKLQLI